MSVCGRSHPLGISIGETAIQGQHGCSGRPFLRLSAEIPLVDDYWALVRNSILFRRGWILQEWLLSKRLLWYTPTGLFFECQTNTPRTDGQEAVNSQLAKPDLQAHLWLKASFHFTDAPILHFWYHALEVYSACHLTKPKQDRILAVAGLAEEWHRYSPGRSNKL